MKRDIVWGYLSQFLQYGAALLVLPLLLRRLSSAELGVWYVFMTISTLVNMLDMGFTPTLARNVSYVMGGARNLQASGYQVTDTPGQVDYGLLRAIIDSSRRIFLLMAMLALLLLASGGSWYILRINHGQINEHRLLSAWGVFVAATVINLYYKYFTPLLQGRELFIRQYKASTISNLAFVVVTLVLLYLDWGLLGVALGFLVSALLGRWLSWWFFYDEEICARLTAAQPAALTTGAIFLLHWHNAWRMGVGVIGAFLILRANTLLASAYLGLDATASYAFTLQVFTVLQSLANVVFTIQQPQLAKFRIQNDKKQMVATIEIGLASALGLYVIGAGVLIMFGAPLVHLIGGHTTLLARPLLAWLAVTIFLELNHSLAATVIVTGNRVPFVKAAIGSGLTIFFLSWSGLTYGHQRIAWLIATQFVVQLTYNNWKWPLQMAQELHLSYGLCVFQGARRILGRIFMPTHAAGSTR